MIIELEVEEGDRIDTDLGKWDVDELYEERGKDKIRVYDDWRAAYQEFEVEEFVRILREEATKVAVYTDEG